MLLNKETKDLQSKLTEFVRNGKLPLIKGAKQDKLHHYRRLVYNIIFNSLSNAYPISSGLLGEERWKELVDEFFINHNPQDPQIWSFPFELYEYVLKSDYTLKSGKSYLNDLLFFEWIEMEVYAMEDTEIDKYIQLAKKLEIKDNFVLNPYIKMFSFEYPVFRKEEKIEEMEKGKYFIICFRDIDTFKVHYLEVDALSMIFIENLYDNNGNLKISLDLTSELINAELEIENIFPLIEVLNDKGIILGIRE